MAIKKIYHVENYDEFPDNVTEIFENYDNGFEISEELEKIGYQVNDQGLCGNFETFQKIDDSFSILYSDITETEKNEFNEPF